MVMQWSAPVSSTAATAHAPTGWCSTLRAPIPRAYAVPDSPPTPIVSRRSSVACVVPTCRCRAEGLVPRHCRNTLSNQAGFLSALPRSLPNGCLVYDGSVPAPDLSHLLQGTSQVLPVQDLGEQRAGRNRLGLPWRSSHGFIRRQSRRQLALGV